MSGSVSSLILIAVVWLLLLAPLFLRNQSPVRRTTTALSETRVLHEGGDGIERSRKRPLPAESLYHADVDEEIELVESEPEGVVIDDTGRSGPLSRLVKRRSGTQSAQRAARDERDPYADQELVTMPGVVDGEVVDYRPLDDADTGEFAPVNTDVVDDAPDKDAVVAAEDSSYTVIAADGVDEDSVDGDSDDGDAEVEPDADVDADTGTDAERDAEDDTERPTDDVAGIDAPLVAVPDHREDRFTDVPDAYIRGGDIDVSVGTSDPVDEWDGDADEAGGEMADPDDEQPEQDDLSEEDLDYAAARRGRGFYDPVASQHLAQIRQTRRKRVLSVLAALCVIAVIASVVLGGAMWLTVVATAGMTGAYLYFLRRQVVEESKLHRRRVARMRRARQGVRSTSDRELGVPDRLLRPGAVVLETDEFDPEFADLEEFDATGYPGFPVGAGEPGDAPTAGYDDYIEPADDHAQRRSHIRAV